MKIWRERHEKTHIIHKKNICNRIGSGAHIWHDGPGGSICAGSGDSGRSCDHGRGKSGRTGGSGRWKSGRTEGSGRGRSDRTAEPKDPEEEDPTEPEDPEEEEPGDPEGEDPDGTETPGTETPVIPPVTIPPMAMAVPMDTSDSMYAQLEQFLTLIADRFQIYTVAVVELTDPTNPSDPSAWQPTVPEEAVEVSLAIPEGYDPSRTVVAEIGQSAGSQMPAWTEITYQNINGGAVFKTDHSGLFVIAEEKQWKDIPASLEMTSKVDRLELTKVYPSGSRTSGALPASLKYSTAVPLTGDDYSVFIWGGITVLAAAAVIAGIIIIIKRRKIKKNL